MGCGDGHNDPCVGELWTSHIHVGLNQSNLLSNFIECMQVQYNEIKGGVVNSLVQSLHQVKLSLETYCNQSVV